MTDSPQFLQQGARMLFIDLNIAKTPAAWLQAPHDQPLDPADFEGLAQRNGYRLRGVFEAKFFGLDGDKEIAVFMPDPDDGRPVEVLFLTLLPE